MHSVIFILQLYLKVFGWSMDPLEDINKDAGPLAIVNASHKFPVLTNEKLNLNIPSSEKELKKLYYLRKSY